MIAERARCVSSPQLRPRPADVNLKVMRRPAIVDGKLAQLVRDASMRPMTDPARERQLVSLAYGNVTIENDRVTKPLVADALRDPASK